MPKTNPLKSAATMEKLNPAALELKKRARNAQSAVVKKEAKTDKMSNLQKMFYQSMVAE